MNPIRSAAFVVFAACSLLFTACEEKSTSENFDKVKNGMSLSQVEAILGKGTDDTPAAGYGVSSGGVMESKTAAEKTYYWPVPNAAERFVVIFKDGKVVQATRMPK